MISIENSLIIIIDIQEKLLSMLKEDTISDKAAKLLQAGQILGIPEIITEQYPQGLGYTTVRLRQKVSENAVFIEKQSFSVMQEKGFRELLSKFKRNKILIGGIETHICVYQTVSDLIKEGYEVELVKDITASRNEFDFNTGIERMKQLGVRVTSLETALFELLKTSSHPNFREIQRLIK